MAHVHPLGAEQNVVPQTSWCTSQLTHLYNQAMRAQVPLQVWAQAPPRFPQASADGLIKANAAEMLWKSYLDMKHDMPLLHPPQLS